MAYIEDGERERVGVMVSRTAVWQSKALEEIDGIILGNSAAGRKREGGLC
jgi:hypothetical protein